MYFLPRRPRFHYELQGARSVAEFVEHTVAFLQVETYDMMRVSLALAYYPVSTQHGRRTYYISYFSCSSLFGKQTSSV